MKEFLPGLRAKSEYPSEYTIEEACKVIASATGTQVTESYLFFLIGEYAKRKGLSLQEERELHQGPLSQEVLEELLEIERGIHPPRGKEKIKEISGREEIQLEATLTAFWKEKAKFLARLLEPKAEAFREKWLGRKKPFSTLKEAEDWIKKELQREGRKSSTKERGEVLRYPSSDGWIKTVSIPLKKGSSLYVLHTLACEMAEEASWGEEAHWVGFILTGLIPQGYLLGTVTINRSQELGISTKIKIRANAWVTPQELAEFYRELKDELERKLAGFIRISAYKRKRPSWKILALINFVEENEEKSWEERFKAWNKAYPELKYENLNSFKTSYHKAKKFLTRLVF
jgi:hypothetical protein